MDKRQLTKQLMDIFVGELVDAVRSLNDHLLALEKAPGGRERTEHFTTLLRTAHSLKGAARSASVPLIEDASHRLEDVLLAARDGTVELDADVFSVLFATADAIEEASMRLREQQDLTDAPLATLLPRLEAAAGKPGAHATASQPPAPARPRKAAAAPPPAASAPAPEAKPREKEASAPAATVPTAPETVPEAAGIVGTVRVLAEKLDTLLAQSGELLLARRRVQTRAQQLIDVRESMTDWKADWAIVEKALTAIQLQDRLRSEPGRPLPSDGAGAAWLFPRGALQVLRQNGNRLQRLEKELEKLAVGMDGDSRELDLAAGALDDEVRRVRMFPFAEACQGLDRVVRDLAQAGGKEVDLVVEGGAVQLDRSVLEGLKDPLRHLVRNAVDHGAESPEARRAAGKPPRARVTVAASLRGAQVEVVVRDDGRGLNLEALRRKLREKKLPEPPDERELAQAIFLPGLSTAPIITEVSGRGIGLDVVKSRVEALHGTIDLSFTAGSGTRFILAVPLTLTMLRALLVSAAGHTFAFVGTNVEKFVRVAPAELRSVEGREMLALGGSPLPVASLAETLGLPAREPARADGSTPGLIVTAGEKRMVFVVEEFLDEQEIVVKSLGARIRNVRHVSGATILPSGRIALVLNAANLVRMALGRHPTRGLAAGLDKTGEEVKKRVVLAEDSLTTRTLEKSILEAAGYEVFAAADGQAAWQLLEEHGADLVVSDVEMPRLDGFGFAETVRGSKRWRDLPFVLVTARETEQDKARGIAVGANAYLVKSAFDQKSLLETIAQLL